MDSFPRTLADIEVDEPSSVQIVDSDDAVGSELSGYTALSVGKMPRFSGDEGKGEPGAVAQRTRITSRSSMQLMAREALEKAMEAEDPVAVRSVLTDPGFFPHLPQVAVLRAREFVTTVDAMGQDTEDEGDGEDNGDQAIADLESRACCGSRGP